MDKLLQLIQNRKYAVALEYSKEYEIVASVAPNDASTFYTIYLLLLLWEDDIVEARHLWLRAPEYIKGASDILSSVWEIGQHIYNKDSGSAHVAIHKIAISPELHSLLDSLRIQLRNRELNNVRAYSRIPIDELSALLGMKEDDVVQTVQKLGWGIDDDLSVVKPKKIEENDGSDINGGGLLDQGDLVRTLSSYVAHFESKPIDMSTKGGGALGMA